LTSNRGKKMNRNSAEYKNLVLFWAHGDSRTEFDSKSMNRVKEILNDFPNVRGSEVIEVIKRNEHFRDDYGLKYFDIHHREGFVAEDNDAFYADVLAEIEKCILEIRRWVK